MELPRAYPDGVPRDRHTQHAQHHGKEDEGKADSIHTHAVGQVPGRNPAHALDELQCARAPVEAQVERGGDSQCGQRGREANPPCQPFAEYEAGGCSCQGQKNGHREDRIGCHRPKTASAIAARTPAAMMSP